MSSTTFPKQIAHNQSTPRCHVAIVGGGLVGSLATIYFAKHGWDISLFELRKDLRIPENQDSNFHRTINLALSVRGLSALKTAGLNLDTTVLSSAIPMKGRMIHSVSGKLTSLSYSVFGKSINSIGRAMLLELLLNTAEKFENVKIYFQHQMRSCNFDAGTLELENKQDGSIVEAKFDLIIGADGAYSTVRNQLMRVVRMNFQQEYISHGYCELTIPPKINSKGEMEYAIDPNHLHIWPRHTFMMIALPNKDKSFTCTLFMPHINFDEIKTEQDLLRFFEKYYPDTITLIGPENLKEAYFRNPKGALMSVKCNPYHYKDRVVILGDAAHTMVPFYGQGMNCGFEDVEILDSILKKYNLSGIPQSDFEDKDAKAEFRKALSLALEEYTKYRHIDATTVCDLAMYNYLEMRSSVVSRRFLIQKKIEGWLHWWFPKRVIPLYTMVSFSTIRYSEVWRRWKLQEFLINVAVISTFWATFMAATWLGLKHGFDVDNPLKQVFDKLFSK
ncbi:hypothetical protein G9A89_005351 [Geosiphon pyriformis]|nr:hypothetical protein G9A89_005351 [Geosiphon pyriformis]